MNESHEITTIVTSTPLDLAVSAWLEEKGKRWNAEKEEYEHTRTSKAYEDTIRQFRASLQQVGMDLDSKPTGNVALVAQKFARYSARGRVVRTATENQRLSSISSFYEYCHRKGPDSPLYIEHNPIEQVKRDRVYEYATAEALDDETVYADLRRIDQQTLRGARDYAILCILLQTGRRAQEVATLQRQHVNVHNGKARVTFEHTKGEKRMQDDLPVSVTDALLRWIRKYYGDELETLAPNAPLWVSLAHDTSYGKPLGYQSINALCKKHLGTSKVHATRHTFAHLMEKLGASASEIQARLGHASLATTGRYLSSLRRAENSKADALAALYGIE